MMETRACSFLLRCMFPPHSGKPDKAPMQLIGAPSSNCRMGSFEGPSAQGVGIVVASIVGDCSAHGGRRILTKPPKLPNFPEINWKVHAPMPPFAYCAIAVKRPGHLRYGYCLCPWDAAGIVILI